MAGDNANNDVRELSAEEAMNQAMPEHDWGVVKSCHVCRGGDLADRNRGIKRVAKAAMTGASLGGTAAQLATNTGAIALATGAAGAASATGIGLVAVGGAVTLAGIGFGASSLFKTDKHIGRLLKIQARAKSYQCTNLSSDPFTESMHRYVISIILPWIIHQKKHKRYKKGVDTLGGGLLTGLWSLGRKAGKWASGTLGKKRSRYAEFLAVHFLTSQCWLADAIVSELYSPGEMIWMKEPERTSAEVAPLLADKMKSV
jgi:hypothetical protein